MAGLLTRPSVRLVAATSAACESEAILGGDHLVAFGLKRGDHLVEARAVGPDSVTEHDARFALRRFHFVLLFIFSPLVEELLIGWRRGRSLFDELGRFLRV